MVAALLSPWSSPRAAALTTSSSARASASGRGAGASAGATWSGGGEGDLSGPGGGEVGPGCMAHAVGSRRGGGVGARGEEGGRRDRGGEGGGEGKMAVLCLRASRLCACVCVACVLRGGDKGKGKKKKVVGWAGRPAKPRQVAYGMGRGSPPRPSASRWQCQTASSWKEASLFMPPSDLVASLILSDERDLKLVVIARMFM